MKSLGYVYNYTTEDIIKIAKKFNFKLFIDNFNKNNNSFPYVNSKDVKFIVVQEGENVYGILAYSLPESLDEYRRQNKDPNINLAHLWDIEVLENFRGQALSAQLLFRLFGQDLKGITLKVLNEDLIEFYKKFGFELYSDLKMIKIF